MPAPAPPLTDEDLRALATEVNPTIWKPKLRELLSGIPDGSVNTSALFVHIGALREKLLVMIGEPGSDKRDERGMSIALSARELLALWSDPRDTAIIDAWLKERDHFASRAPDGVTAATLPLLMEKWRDVHFTKEGFADPAKRTANWIHVLAKTDDHALIHHEVRYLHWGYWLQLVAVRVEDTWTVRIVLHTMIEHYD